MDTEKKKSIAYAIFRFAFGVIPLETVIGISLILGCFIFIGGAAGALLMVGFVFGACLVQDWSLAATQMVCVIGFFFLLFFQEYDGFGLDHLRNTRRRRAEEI